ncbi:MAG: glycosyltransferase family 39 protein [Phycisphaerae bacterium]|jgi:hypothetical protein|nr:glycosyltransferase family 39 protein [Phycisphaerae bacterium]
MAETVERQLDTDPPSGTAWIGGRTLLCPRRLLVWSLIVLVYLIGVCPMWWPTSDSALYLSLSHSLAEGRGFVHNGQVHTLVAPGLPLVLAGLERTFGVGYLAGNMFTALCGLGVVALVYLSVRRLSDDSIAFAVAVVTALSYPFYSNSHRILTQIPFALVFWGMFYACLRRRTGSAWWLVVVALLSLLSIVIRPPGLLLVGPLGVGLFFNGDRIGGERRLRWCGAAMLGPMFIIAGAMLAVSWMSSGRLPGYLEYAFSVLGGGGVGGRVSAVGQAAARLPDVVTKLLVGQRGLLPLGVLAGGVIVAGMMYLWRSGQRYIAIFAVLSLGAYLMMGPDMIGTRYFLTLIPIYIYAGVQGLCLCVRWACRRRQRPCTSATFVLAVGIFAGLCVACNIPKVLRNSVFYSYAAWTDPDRYYHVTRSEKYADFFAIADALAGENQPPGKVGGPKDGERVIHHLTGRIVLPYTPGKQERNSAAEAERIIVFVESHPEIQYFVFDVRNRDDPSTSAFFARLDAWLTAARASGAFEPLYEGEYYAAFRRGSPKTQTSQPRGDRVSLQP